MATFDDQSPSHNAPMATLSTSVPSSDAGGIEFYDSGSSHGSSHAHLLRQPTQGSANSLVDFYGGTPEGSHPGTNGNVNGSSHGGLPPRPHHAPKASFDSRIEFFDGSSEGSGLNPPGSSSQGTSELDDPISKGLADVIYEEQALYKEAAKFKDAAVVSMVEREVDNHGGVQKALEITMEDGVTFTVELDSGEKRLIELGYSQELDRVLNWFQLFCIAISTIGVFPYLASTFPFAFLNGGPAGMIWYWWISVFFVHIVGLCFSEIASSFPTAGSLYYWAAALSGPGRAPLASFFTGWLEFIGLSVGVSSTLFCFAFDFVKPFVFMCTGRELDEYAIFGITLASALICLGLNLLPVSVLGHFFVGVAVFEILTALVLIIALPAVATTHQTASFVFGSFESFRTITQTPSNSYSFLITLLYSQWVLFGYDSVAHMAEETKRSDRTSPMAIMASISVMSILGWLLIVSACFSIQDVENALMAPNALFMGPNAPGLMWYQIMWDAFYSRFESGLGAQILAFCVSLASLFRSAVILLAASRVCFSLARDNGIPFSRLWKQVSLGANVPVNAVLFSMAVGFLFLLPTLDSAALLMGIVSISSMAWVAAYAIPLFCRCIQSETDFYPGPFYLADYVGVLGGKILHGVAFLWIMFTVALFCLPYLFPITPQNFNWSSVTVSACLSLLAVWWALDARRWFRGPLKNGADGQEDSDRLTPRKEEALSVDLIP